MVVVMRLGQYLVAPAGHGVVVIFNQIAALLANAKVAVQINMGVVISISKLRMAHGLTIMMTGRIIFGSKMMMLAHRSIILRV